MSSRQGTDEQGKIFVGGIARDIDEGLLTSYFSQFGSVVLATVMRDKFGISRGFGFVAFDPPEAAMEVLRKVHVIEGRTIEIKQAVKHDRVYAGGINTRPGAPLPSNGVVLPGASPVPADKDQSIFVNRQVYVGGLPYHITEKEVREYFNQFGPVVSANLKYDFGQNPPKFRGFGFVNFVEEESVEKALENYSSHQLGGKWIEVKRSKHSHVVQGENSGVIMPQMAQGSGTGRGGAYDSKGVAAPAYKDPYGGVAYSDPYGGVASAAGRSMGNRAGETRTTMQNERQSSGPVGRSMGGASYRSTPYTTSNAPYSSGASSQYPPQNAPYSDYSSNSNNFAQQRQTQRAPTGGSAAFDPYMSSQQAKPTSGAAPYAPKSGGWRSQQPINPPM